MVISMVTGEIKEGAIKSDCRGIKIKVTAEHLSVDLERMPGCGFKVTFK